MNNRLRNSYCPSSVNCSTAPPRAALRLYLHLSLSLFLSPAVATICPRSTACRQVIFNACQIDFGIRLTCNTFSKIQLT